VVLRCLEHRTRTPQCSVGGADVDTPTRVVIRPRYVAADVCAGTPTRVRATSYARRGAPAEAESPARDHARQCKSVLVLDLLLS